MLSLHRILARRHWLIRSTVQIPKIGFEVLQVAASLSPTINFNYFCVVVASSLSSIIINWLRKLSKSLSQFIIFLIRTAILALHVYFLLSCCCYVISVFHRLIFVTVQVCVLFLWLASLVHVVRLFTSSHVIILPHLSLSLRSL